MISNPWRNIKNTSKILMIYFWHRLQFHVHVHIKINHVSDTYNRERFEGEIIPVNAEHSRAWMDIEGFGAWNAVDGNTATFGAIEKRTREEQPWIRVNLDKVRDES